MANGPRPRSGTPGSQVDFVVVGAGLAGLRTAVDLTAAGASVTVFEARERVGGRVLFCAPLEAAASGPPLVLDLGAQWVGPGRPRCSSSSGNWICTWFRPRHQATRSGALTAASSRGGARFPGCRPRALAEVLVGAARVASMSNASRRTHHGGRLSRESGTALRPETGYAGIYVPRPAGNLRGSTSPAMWRSSRANRPCSEFSSTSARLAPPAIWARPRRSGCARGRTRSPATSPGGSATGSGSPTRCGPSPRTRTALP